MHTEYVSGKTDVEWVHKIGSHIAAGDSLDEVLAIAESFAVALVLCDLCFIYVRQGAELVLWVRNHLHPSVLDPAKLPIGESYTVALAQARVPVALSTNDRQLPGARIFDHWSVDPGEAFVSVPLLARKELVGVMNLQHRQPRRYSLREVKLLSAVGHLLGAGIGISRLESRNSDLVSELETRKLVERGKGILQRDHGLSEEQAYLTLQRYSRDKRKSMKEIAQAIILGDEFKRSALNDAAPGLRRSRPGNITVPELGGWAMGPNLDP